MSPIRPSSHRATPKPGQNRVFKSPNQLSPRMLWGEQRLAEITEQTPNIARSNQEVGDLIVALPPVQDPELEGSIDLPNPGGTRASEATLRYDAARELLYLAQGNGSFNHDIEFQCFDVSDPSSIVKLAGRTDATANTSDRRSSFVLDTDRQIAFHCLGFGSFELEALDLSSPSSIGFISSVAVSNGPVDVCIDTARQLAFVLVHRSSPSADHWIETIDISNPAAMSVLAVSPMFPGAVHNRMEYDQAREVFVTSGSTAQTSTSRPPMMWDAGDELNVAQITTFPSAPGQAGLALDLDRDLAFIHERGNDAFVVHSLTSTLGPYTKIGTVTDSRLDLAQDISYDPVHQRALAVGINQDTVLVIDVSTPTAPVVDGVAFDAVLLDGVIEAEYGNGHIFAVTNDSRILSAWNIGGA